MKYFLSRSDTIHHLWQFPADVNSSDLMRISFKNARITDSAFIISMYLKIVLSSQVHAEKMVKIQAGISVYIFPEVLPPIAECQMPAAPEVQASKTVNSLVWTNPMKVLQYQ